MNMQYNICETCGAKGGRAGNLIRTVKYPNAAECLNCHDTRESGTIVIHSHLRRIDEEIQKTFSILSNKSNK